MYSLRRIKIGANIIIMIPWCIACENGVRWVLAVAVLVPGISRVRVCPKRKFSIFILWYWQREIPTWYGVWPCVRCGCCSCFSFSMFLSFFSPFSFHRFVLFSCVYFSALAKCSCLCVTVYPVHMSRCGYTHRANAFVFRSSSTLFSNGGHPIVTRNTIYHVISDFTWHMRVIWAPMPSVVSI